MSNDQSPSAANAHSDDRVWEPSSRTRIKICGITNLADAVASVSAGADMLGFNFYRPSPRYLTAESARAIIAELPGSVLPVGVFVNESSPQDVIEIAESTGIRAIQLHGDEPPEFCAALNRWPVIKAFRIGTDFDPGLIARYETTAILLDGYSIKAHGGTGKTFDWEIAKQLRGSGRPIFLAGGLGVDNVRRSIEEVHPFAVDACSRLESRPGTKDRDLVVRFVQQVHAADENA